MTTKQLQSAMSSLQALIVQARFAAFDAGANSAGELLDDMELLPEFVSEDRLAEFDETLRDIVEKHPECQSALDHFDRQPIVAGQT